MLKKFFIIKIIQFQLSYICDTKLITQIFPRSNTSSLYIYESDISANITSIRCNLSANINKFHASSQNKAHILSTDSTFKNNHKPFKICLSSPPHSFLSFKRETFHASFIRQRVLHQGFN